MVDDTEDILAMKFAEGNEGERKGRDRPMMAGGRGSDHNNPMPGLPVAPPITTVSQNQNPAKDGTLSRLGMALAPFILLLDSPNLTI